MIASYPAPSNQSSEPNFLVGVEYALSESSIEGCKALVDRVKGFTNLFVIDSLNIALDYDSLNEVADYVYDSGLYFIVFYISLHEEETFHLDVLSGFISYFRFPARIHYRRIAPAELYFDPRIMTLPQRL